MPTFARILRIFAIITWLGGLLFFASVVPQVAFRVLASRDASGLIVGACLHFLHNIGFWCGMALLLSLRLLGTRTRYFKTQLALVCIMLALTIGSDRLILNPMEHDRIAAGGRITALLADSPIRKDFDARHAWSTRIEVGVLLAGIVIATLIAIDGDKAQQSI